MTTLMQANRQWASRPSDERFLSLTEMKNHFDWVYLNSSPRVVSSRRLEAQPAADNKGLTVIHRDGMAAPTHWAFDQLARLGGAPPGYLRSLPSPLAADCVNYGLKIARDIEDVGILIHSVSPGDYTLRAATGPKYGRIWNNSILRGLTETFGDGVTGVWKVPGEFGHDVEVTKENTTLFAGDRDMFVFLADERNRIEIPNRRNGEPGSLARGFFVWNSEVGSASFGIATFLFDYVCCNRIVWGAQDVKEIRIRHTVSAPDRFLQRVAPALETYAQSSAKSIIEGIENARKAEIDDVDEFLRKRFSKGITEALKATHLMEEDRPIETLWDVSTAITAQARSIEYQNERVELERKAGEILSLAQ